MIKKSECFTIDESTCSYAGTKDFMNRIVGLLPVVAKTDDGFEMRMEASSIGKLLFNDGYVDIKTREFHKGFTKDIMFFHKINMNYEGD